MPLKTWTDVKALIGEDLALFTIFMSSLEASDIIEGFIKVAKGAKYVSDPTLDSMYKDIVSGIARDTLTNHILSIETSADLLENSVFSTGLEDLVDWMEITNDKEASEYFSYLSRWDLAGHDWMTEKPATFGQFTSLGPRQ